MITEMEKLQKQLYAVELGRWMKTVKLQPYDSHKSFYGKAIIEFYQGGAILYSYGTPVIAIDSDKNIYNLWGGYSATTARHISAFCSYFNLPNLNKRDLDGLPIYYYNRWNGTIDWANKLDDQAEDEKLNEVMVNERLNCTFIVYKTKYDYYKLGMLDRRGKAIQCFYPSRKTRRGMQKYCYMLNS